MLFLSLTQVSSPGDDTKLHREFRKREVHSYRVHVETDQGVAPMTYDYTFWTRCEDPTPDHGSPELTVKIMNLKQSVNNQRIEKAQAGLGKFNMPLTGLPGTLRDSFGMEPFWGPLLDFYLPPEVKDDAFEANDPVGGAWNLTGHGTCKNGVFELMGKIEQPNSAAIQVSLAWTIDGRGWLSDGEGSVVDPSGTLNFKIRRA